MPLKFKVLSIGSLVRYFISELGISRRCSRFKLRSGITSSIFVPWSPISISFRLTNCCKPSRLVILGSLHLIIVTASASAHDTGHLLKPVNSLTHFSRLVPFGNFTKSHLFLHTLKSVAFINISFRYLTVSLSHVQFLHVISSRLSRFVSLLPVMLLFVLFFVLEHEVHLQSFPLKSSVKVVLSYMQLSQEQFPELSHEQFLHIYEFSRFTVSNTDKDCE